MRGATRDIYAQQFDIEQNIAPEQNGIPFGNYNLVIMCISLAIIVIHIKKKIKTIRIVVVILILTALYILIGVLKKY